VLTVTAITLAAFPSASHAQNAVGAEKCRACHVKSYDAWMKSRHARAHLVLPPNRRADAQCLRCHSPAESESAGLHVGVTCESCHGNGEWYSLRFIMRDKELARDLGLESVGEASCKKCHSATTVRGAKFSFIEWVKRIAHADK
jgi:hypothetical protein